MGGGSVLGGVGEGAAANFHHGVEHKVFDHTRKRGKYREAYRNVKAHYGRKGVCPLYFAC
jgi:hypothetical protein